jgi:serine/threonine protein kinase
MFVALPTKEPQYLKIKRKLGEGSFGKVYEIKYNDLPSALKIVEKEKLADKELVKQEIHTIQYLMKNFPDCVQNIICYYEVLEDEDQFYFISEMMETDLFDFTVANKSFINLSICKKIKLIYSMVQQMLEGLEILHKVGIFHRDVKLENFLMGKDKNGKHVLKITDFGLSCIIPNCSWEKNIGSREYIHPDILIDPSEKWKFSYDLYAIGICIYVMLTRDYMIHLDEINYLIQELESKNIETVDFMQYYNTNYKQNLENLLIYREMIKQDCGEIEMKKFDRLYKLVEKLANPELNRNMNVQQAKIILSI